MLTRRDLVLGAAGSSLFLGAGFGQAQVSTDLTSLSLEEASRLIRTRRTSSLDLTNACLARIRTYEPLLNAFITITDEYARNRATMLDLELRRGRWRGSPAMARCLSCQKRRIVHRFTRRSAARARTRRLGITRK